MLLLLYSCIIRANGLPFEAVACDEWYGRKDAFRKERNQAGILYMADVPKSTSVSVLCPDTGEAVPIPVCALASDPATRWQAVHHRASPM